jgi:hypothetical protein
MLPALFGLALLAGAIVLILLLRNRGNATRGDSNTTAMSPARTQTLESKLALLAECGLSLSPEFTIDDLLESWDREAYEEPGYDLVLVGLGMTEERPPWRPHCQNLWHFDTECIEDNGSYVEIAKRMASMAGSSLPLEDIADHVDIEHGEAWLRFTCRGKEHTIVCDVQDDWVDTKVFGHFVQLLATTEPNKIFVYYDLGGQDCIIGCLTRQQLEALQEVVPGFVPLS